MFGETFLHPANFVHFAGLFYAVGLLVRDELKLRLLILTGTGFYIAYYSLFPQAPMWGAIAVSVVLGLANITILITIMFERTTFAMSNEERALFQRFHTLNPGQFRKIMNCAERVRYDATTVIATEGLQPERLFFLVKGPAIVLKNGKRISIGGGEFIGEISFISGSNATASVAVEPGASVIEWRVDKLRKLFERKPALRNAMLALFNQDLASKLSVSVRRAGPSQRTTVSRSAARVTAV